MRTLGAVWTSGVLLAACGGGAAPPPAKSGGDGASAQPESLGITGGIDSIAVPSGMRLGPPLAMRLVESGHPVKLDGLVREWQLLSPAKVKSEPPPSGQGIQTALQYDDTKIYLAADVDDAAFDRTGKFAEGEDHVSLFLAFPTGSNGFSAHEVGFYAGKPGESAGAVKWLSGPKKGSNVAGAKIVEAPKDGGYTLEAVLPWAAFGESGKTRLGLRGAVRLYDPTGTVATGNGSASDVKALPQLLTEPEIGLVEGFLQQKGLSEDAPSLDVLADVAGDAEKERIAVYGSYVTVVGHHYRGGKEFFYRDVGGEVKSLEARSVATKGKDDLVLTHRTKHPNGTAEVLEVWAFNGDQPDTLFAQEVVVAQGNKSIKNVATIKPGIIELSVGPATGWDAATYKPVVVSLVSPILSPWGSVKSRTLKLQDNRFVTADEVAQAPAPGAAASPGLTAAVTPLPSTPRDLPSPQVKATTNLAEDLLAQFKKENGIGAGDKPKVNLETNLAEDSRPERAVLFGRNLAVFGPGFRGGKGYVFAKLEAFAKDEDVGEISAKDLTGDGRAELVVRGTRRQGAGAAAIASDITMVYAATPEGMKRLFAIETAREQNGKRVQGMMQFVPGKGGGFEIDVRPGNAKGFSAKDYPWKEDEPGGSIEPLLLPWGSKKALRYRFDGQKFTLAS